MKILILDDDKSFLDMAKSYIDQFPKNWVEGIITDSIREAESIISNGDIDLCIVDILMPIENGIDFVNRLNKSNVDFFITTADFANERVTDKMNSTVIYAQTMPKNQVINCLRNIVNGCIRKTV